MKFFGKRSLIGSLLVAAAGGFFVWYGGGEIREVRMEVERHRAVAHSGRQAPERDAGTPGGDREMAGLNRLVRAAMDQGEAAFRDAEFVKELKNGIESIDAGRHEALAAFLKDLEAGPDLPARRTIQSYLLNIFLSANPSLLPHFAEFFEAPYHFKVFGNLISQWAAEEDPSVILAWFRQRPHLIQSQNQRSLVLAVAEGDPSLAFGLITEFGVGPTEVIPALFLLGKANGQTGETLKAFRNFIDGIEDKELAGKTRDDALTLLGQSLVGEGFRSSAPYLESAGFSIGEMNELMAYFGGHPGGEEGLWMEWLPGKVSAEQMRKSIWELMRTWAEGNYPSAGKWLDSTTLEGEAKEVAVRRYAMVVAEYDPQVAVEWAETLPEGWHRTNVFKEILRNWARNDPEGAEAFAEERGLERE